LKSSSKPDPSFGQSKPSVNNRLTFKIAVSLAADLMKKCDMPYAMSVFLPECGFSQEILSKQELVEVLALQHDE